VNNEQTLEKMKKLRLCGMYESLKNALETGLVHDFKADEFIAHLIEAELEDKTNRKIGRLIQNAKFKFIAQIEDIKYGADRNLNKSQVLKLSELKWIAEGENIIITGFTGTGKTFLSNALGLRACTNGYTVECINCNTLFYRLKYAKSCGNYMKELEKIIKKDLLILDDFGLEILDKESRISLFEIMEERTDKKSMIISSQIPIENWYDIIGEKTIADAICDRIISNAQFINLEGDSMRKNKKNKS
jgi:DNA replication protein DnaC